MKKQLTQEERENRDEKNREGRARGRLKTQGFILKKSRTRNPKFNDAGGYMIVNLNNVVEAGEKFDLSLDDVERFINE